MSTFLEYFLFCLIYCIGDYMKRKMFNVKYKSNNQKLLYLILIGLALLAFILGIIFIFFITDDNLIYIKESLSSYFNSIDISISSFFKNLFNNFIIIFLIWILGISIIGIPLVLLIFLFKSFIFGFSFSSIVYSFKLKGFLISLIHLLPGKLLYLVTLLLLTFYSVSFSLKLFRNLFLKRPTNFKESMDKYFKILMICLFSSLIVTLYDSFLANYLVNMFDI